MSNTDNIRAWLNGDKLRSRQLREQYPLIGLIVGLIFLYILTGYQAAKQQHRLTDSAKNTVWPLPLFFASVRNTVVPRQTIKFIFAKK